MAHGTTSRRIRPWSHPRQAFSRANGSAEDDAEEITRPEAHEAGDGLVWRHERSTLPPA